MKIYHKLFLFTYRCCTWWQL